VFALTCEDAWSVTTALTAYDARDPFSRENAPRRARAPDTRLRCGVLCESDLRFFGDETARHAYARTLESLKALDAELVEIDYAPYAETARLLYEGPWVAERLAAIEPFYRSHAGEMDPAVRTIIAAGDGYSARETFEAQYRLQALKRESAQVWGDIDMLAVPTTGTIYRLDEVADEPIALNANLGYYTNFVNLLDLAAIAVPAHFRDDGLPFGVTLIAPALEDATLARWGARLHRAVASRLGATQFGFPAASVYGGWRSYAESEFISSIGDSMSAQATPRAGRV
jgi:allophanate hydrolase